MKAEPPHNHKISVDRDQTKIRALKSKIRLMSLVRSMSSALLKCLSIKVCGLTLSLRCPMQRTGSIINRLLDIGLWIGFGKVWTRKLVQTPSKTYLGYPRDRFQIRFEPAFWPELSQILSKTLSRKTRSSILPVRYGDILTLNIAQLLCSEHT